VGKIAGQMQRGHARLVGLKPEGVNVAHQADVIADIFGQAILLTAHVDLAPRSLPSSRQFEGHAAMYTEINKPAYRASSKTVSSSTFAPLAQSRGEVNSLGE
jgi:hypothetical protein